MSTELVWISSQDNTTTDLYTLSENLNQTHFEYYDMNDDKTKCNLVELKHINLPTIMNVLQQRYIENNIYTYYGEV